jgi:hypothetical protein
MLTNWSAEELVEMRELAFSAIAAIKGSETRYGLRWHGLSEAIIVLDRLLRGRANQHDRTLCELSERDAKLLTGLHAASMAQPRSAASTADYAGRVSERR